MIISKYDEILLRLTAPASMLARLGVVSLKKSHDIVVLSFCNIVKAQAKCYDMN